MNIIISDLKGCSEVKLRDIVGHNLKKSPLFKTFTNIWRIGGSAEDILLN